MSSVVRTCRVREAVKQKRTETTRVGLGRDTRQLPRQGQRLEAFGLLRRWGRRVNGKRVSPCKGDSRKASPRTFSRIASFASARAMK